MAEIKHAESNDQGSGEFDEFNRVVQDIREMRGRTDSRPGLYRRARSAEEADIPEDIPSEESLPLFLSTPADQDWQPADPDQETRAWPSTTWQSSNWQQSTRQQSTRQQNTSQQDTSQQDAWPQDTWQDTWQQDTWQQDTPQQSSRHHDARQQDARQQDPWQHDFTEADRERIQTMVAPTFLKRLVKTGILAATGFAVLAGLFALEDRSGVISKASASLAAALPGFSSSPVRPLPSNARPTATNPAPVVTAAVVPTRQAIAVAYQTALQSQPEIRQPQAAPAAPPAPAPAPAPLTRRIDPDELATLLKRAQGLIDLGDFPGARLLLERAADAHEARAAFILAQTYDPAVLGAADSRSIVPNPEKARLWYHKAAEFGSQEAQQRLAQMN
jgi:hypothetical protein